VGRLIFRLNSLLLLLLLIPKLSRFQALTKLIPTSRFQALTKEHEEWRGIIQSQKETIAVRDKSVAALETEKTELKKVRDDLSKELLAKEPE